MSFRSYSRNRSRGYRVSRRAFMSVDSMETEVFLLQKAFQGAGIMDTSCLGLVCHVCLACFPLVVLGLDAAFGLCFFLFLGIHLWHIVLIRT